MTWLEGGVIVLWALVVVGAIMAAAWDVRGE